MDWQWYVKCLALQVKEESAAKAAGQLVRKFVDRFAGRGQTEQDVIRMDKTDHDRNRQ